jgi:hypothetical protein
MRSSGSASPVSRIRWRRGRVTATGRTGRDTLQLTVEVPDEGALPALAYPSLVGTPQVGDDVLLNTTALAQGLGTGGVAMVVAVPDRLPPDPEGPGHLVKARYTPLQVTVSGVDEQDTEHHALLAEVDDLDGMPVVVADLHSALPAILIGMLATDPDLKVAYVMTDGGALPAGFSRTLDALAPSLAGDGAHRAAGGPARAGGRSDDRDAGPGQPGHRDAVGLLRGCGRRGVQRGVGAGR